MRQRSSVCVSLGEKAWQISVRQILLGVLIAPLACLAQSTSVTSMATSATKPAVSPSFDVASVKLHPSGPLSMTGLMNLPDGVSAMAMTLPMLLKQAYNLRSEDQVFGGPGWTKGERFDIQAKFSDTEIAGIQKMDHAAVTAYRLQMLQALLAERFHLKAHSATRQLPVYELVAAKGGPKLKDVATDTSAHLRLGEDGKPVAGFMQFLQDSSTAQGYSMGALANLLSEPFAKLGRPVLDKTGLTGAYDFTLDWSPRMNAVLPGGAGNSVSPEGTDSIFTALQEIGLKLQPSTGPIEVIVIDYVERPSEN